MWSVTALGRIFRTTVVRLALVYFLAFTGLATFLIVTISGSTDGVLSRQLEQAINDETASLAEQYAVNGLHGLVAGIELRSRRPSAGLYLVTDFTGRPIAGNIADPPLQLLAAADGQPIRITYRRQERDDDTPYHAVVTVVMLPGGFHLVVGRDTSEHEQFRAAITSALGITFATILVLGAISWWYVSRYVLRRIDGMAATSQTIMRGNLSERLVVTGSRDEFDRLALSLNAMLARIEQLMTGLKQVSDNIAHDLKTPLTRMRGRLETALADHSGDDEVAGLIGATLADSQMLIDTFDALLSIARLEAGATGEAGEDIDAGAVMRDLGELYGPVIEDLGATLEVAAGQGVVVRANRSLLTQALANLIDNAIKYALPEGGGGLVRLEASADGSTARLVVRDRGPGIAAEDRRRACERFVRLDASRSQPGSGLGLSLVAAIVHVLGGELTLDDGEPGLIVAITLPAAAVAHPPQ